MSAADRLRELYNKASDRERDENCETFWKIDAIPSAKGKKGKGKGAERVLNPFSEKQILRTAETYKELKKLCEAHELKKTQIGHLHVPKAKGVKEESSSDSEQSGDDETQPDDDRKDPHLMLPNVTLGENDYKGEQTGDNEGKPPGDNKGGQAGDHSGGQEAESIPPDLNELIEKVGRTISDGSPAMLEPKALEEIEKKLIVLRDTEKKIRKVPRRKSRCESEHMIEVASDLLYCSWDRYYAAGVSLMIFLRTSIALAFFPSLAKYIITAHAPFDYGFFWRPLKDAQGNFVPLYDKLGNLLGGGGYFKWDSWGSLPHSFDIPLFLKNLFGSPPAKTFWRNWKQAFVGTPIEEFINTLQNQILGTYEQCQNINDLSNPVFMTKLWVNLKINPFAWEFAKRSVNTILDHIRAMQLQKVSAMLLSLITLNGDGALMFASMFRKMIKYQNCHEFIPAKISCEFEKGDLKITLLTSNWRRLGERPGNVHVLSVDSVQRHRVDITDDVINMIHNLQRDDVLNISNEMPIVNSLRRLTQKGDPRGKDELQMSFKPGLVLKVRDKALFFQHMFDMQDASDCKTYDPAVCSDE